jgi:hypothetical protein
MPVSIKKNKYGLSDLSKAGTRDYRFIPFGIIAIYMLTLLFSGYQSGTYAMTAKHFAFWPYLYFYDLKITLGGIDAFRDKIDPYTVGSIHFNAEPYFCYPSTWKIFSFFPFITMSNLIYIGIGMAVFYYLALWFYIGKIDLFAAIVYTLLLMSSAFLLGVVGGNTDIFIFTLLLIPLLYKRSSILFGFMILALSTLKLFPMGAIICLFNDQKRSMKRTVLLFAAVLILFVVYLFLMNDNLLRISHIIPRPIGDGSYGLWSIPSLVSIHFHFNPAITSYVFSAFGVMFCIAFLVYYKITREKVRAVEINNGNTGTSYMIGAAIFMTSFMMGYSCEYRLIFLVLTIPQILDWIKNGKPLAKTLLLLTILICWQYAFMYNFIPVKYQSHYHAVVQLLVILLFYGHLSIIFDFFLTRFNIASLLTKRNNPIT